MTNISVFGEDKEKQSKKPIEFVKKVYVDCVNSVLFKPSEYEYLCLLGEFTSEYDVIMAWDSGCPKHIYIGHWNDGIVE